VPVNASRLFDREPAANVSDDIVGVHRPRHRRARQTARAWLARSIAVLGKSTRDGGELGDDIGAVAAVLGQ
jgi:hypothetical protein